MNTFFVFIIAFMAVNTVFAGKQLDEKEKSFPVSKGDNLEVSLSNGNVSIGVWDKNEVFVKANNISKNELKFFQANKENKTISVSCLCGESDNFELKIMMPSFIHCDITSGAGDIEIKGNVSGNVSLSTGGGNISIGNVEGAAEISTGGGNITTGSINNDITISTGGGDIKVGKINGKANISTYGGNITVGDVTKSLELSTAGGNIVIGKVGGRADISTAGGNINIDKLTNDADVSTAGGNILINESSSKLDVSTAGGNISLKNISGTIRGSTFSGDIYAELSSAGSLNGELSTNVGSIKLIIPEDAKVNILASVKSYNWSEEDNIKNIESDFKAEISNFENEDRQITAKYIINGGVNPLYLSTTMGKIYLKKK